MPKLNQVVAATGDVTKHAETEITRAYKTLQKNDLFGGQIRSYEAKDEEGDPLPGETERVQQTVAELVEVFVINMATVMDVTATRDYGNVLAKADVKVGDKVLLKDVPVPYLLFLEQRLGYVQNLLDHIPVLDPKYSWTNDTTDGSWHSAPSYSTRNQKVRRNHVLAQATDKHPAQVEPYTEDIPVGTWTTIKTSGAVPAIQVAQWQAKLIDLKKAVKYAREEANALEVQPKQVGNALLKYVFS